MVDVPLQLILPLANPQYAISSFDIVYYGHCFGSLSVISDDILPGHYIFLY